MTWTRRKWLEVMGSLGVGTALGSSLAACDTSNASGGLAEADAGGAAQDGGVSPDANAGYPDAGPEPTGTFRHGLASGDPTDEAVILWTRVSADAPPASIDVGWQLARTMDFAELVARGTFTTNADRDYTVKVDATGLEPATTYYYRFDALGETSPVGRTRTAPRGDAARLRFGVASCSSLGHGWFHAYTMLARRADLDAVIHLGDYIYEYGDGEYGAVRPYDPPHEILTLDDYRRRHRQYKREASVQALHRQHPLIAVWDDHEVADNAWRDGAKNHTEGLEGMYAARKAAAQQAYREYMPYREGEPGKIFRTLRYGALVDLIMLDTRSFGRDMQARSISGADAQAESRTLLGTEQETWLREQLRASTAKWRLLGQQVIFGQTTNFPNPDQWDGYPAARERILTQLRTDAITNVVVLTGDIHSSWALDIAETPDDTGSYDPDTGRGALAVELVAPAISAAALMGPAARASERLILSQRHIKYVNLEKQGYIVLDVTPERVQGAWFFTSRVDRPEASEELGVAYSVRDLAHHLERDDAAAEPRTDGAPLLP